jgi:hypothetical protein
VCATAPYSPATIHRGTHSRGRHIMILVGDERRGGPYRPAFGTIRTIRPLRVCGCHVTRFVHAIADTPRPLFETNGRDRRSLSSRSEDRHSLADRRCRRPLVSRPSCDAGHLAASSRRWRKRSHQATVVIRLGRSTPVQR